QSKTTVPQRFPLTFEWDRHTCSSTSPQEFRKHKPIYLTRLYHIAHVYPIQYFEEFSRLPLISELQSDTSNLFRLVHPATIVRTHYLRNDECVVPIFVALFQYSTQ